MRSAFAKAGMYISGSVLGSSCIHDCMMSLKGQGMRNKTTASCEAPYIKNSVGGKVVEDEIKKDRNG